LKTHTAEEQLTPLEPRHALRSLTPVSERAREWARVSERVRERVGHPASYLFQKPDLACPPGCRRGERGSQSIGKQRIPLLRGRERECVREIESQSERGASTTPCRRHLVSYSQRAGRGDQWLPERPGGVARSVESLGYIYIYILYIYNTAEEQLASIEPCHALRSSTPGRERVIESECVCERDRVADRERRMNHALLDGWRERESKRDLFWYQHGRYVCTPTEAVSGQDLERGHVRVPRQRVGRSSLKVNFPWRLRELTFAQRRIRRWGNRLGPPTLWRGRVFVSIRNTTEGPSWDH
jgi:hypothetical protein